MSTALSSGDTLSHYVISEPLGAGGMGEVYRATDTRLGREVAIKVLPEEFAADAGRLSRFDREAKVLASLSHPNIATLFGLEMVPRSGTDPSSRSGESGDLVFLVMELVEGDDLSQRIAEGPLPVKTVVALGRQIAAGLEAAHRKGIVHRDLKPANIRVSADGTVKILDFGLAKTWDPSPSDLDFTESPTVTAGMTRQGTILGTAPYLSPEQARGQVVDRQTDIWALGCVLYEMLTGRSAFSGETSTDVIVHVLEHEPDWNSLDHTVPISLRRVLGRCLEKDPRDRLRDAGDIALALEDLSTDPGHPSATGAEPVSSPIKKVLPWLVSATALIVAVAAMIGRPPQQQPLVPPTLRFTEPSPAALDMSRIGHYGSAVAISPDGHVLVWVGVTEDETQLWARHFDEEAAHPIDGTEGGVAPFFSPDGKWIGFWADGKLKKVAVRGGAPQTICEVGHVHGASWGEGVIVLDAVGAGILCRVDPGTGQLQNIEIANRTGYLANNPRMLPGSKVTLASTLDGKNVDLVSLETGETTTVVNDGSSGSYLPSGHLLWVQEDNLLAAPFDLSTHEITGDAQTVIEGVLTERDVGFLAHYAVSNEGTLAYLPGTAQSSGMHPTWVGLDGSTETIDLPTESYLSPRISPDGRKLLLSRQTEFRSLWLAEPARGVISPVTSEAGNQYWAIWTPDGEHMIYNSQEGNDPVNLWMQRVDRSTPARRLTTAPVHHLPVDITRDGRTVLFLAATASGDDFNIHLLHLDGEPVTDELLATGAQEVHPALSPDENWLAYATDVTGRWEVYVQRFPELGATVRVSPNGGWAPLWSPSGDRLYYRSENGRRVFAVDVRGGDPIQIGREELLFEGRFTPDIPWGRKWDIHPDGDRFLMLQIGSPEPVEGIRVVKNWLSELEKVVPSND